MDADENPKLLIRELEVAAANDGETKLALARFEQSWKATC
jgi:hypothetical protein